jgi:hypothetical protein
MMNKLKNKASPTSTWFGGIVCNPKALRVSDSTTMIFVKLVHSIKAAGATEMTVIIKMMTIDWLGFPLTPLMLTLTVLFGAVGAAGAVGPVGPIAVPADGAVAPELAGAIGVIGVIGVIGAIDWIGATGAVGAVVDDEPA